MLLQQQQLSVMLMELQGTLGTMQAQVTLLTSPSIRLQQAYPSALSSANLQGLCGIPKPWLRDSLTSYGLPDDIPWTLNLSMHFRDGREREKFFVTYAETSSVWRRITISCDYRNAPNNSMEKDLMNKKFQRDKSALIWSVVRESINDIQFLDSVTNLKVETIDGRLHLYATEDVNEIIPYPPIDLVRHINCTRYKESQVEMKSHLSGFVYLVAVGSETLVRKDIANRDGVDEFLCELHALSKLQASPHVINLKGIVVDDKESMIKGLMLEYAESGALVDILYDYKGKIPWSERENWAYQIVWGVSEVHIEGMSINSLTLSNLVIDAENIVKLISLPKKACAVGWEPPEISELIAQGQKISFHLGLKTDLYQMGMILWALAADDDEPERQSRPLTLGGDTPPYYRALVGICLSQQPRDRVWASELLRMFPLSVARSAVALGNVPEHQIEAPTS